MQGIAPALIFAVPADRPSSVLRFQRQFQHGQFTSGDEGGNGSGAGQAHVLVEGFGVGIGDDAQGAAPHPLGVGAGVIEEGTSKAPRPIQSGCTQKWASMILSGSPARATTPATCPSASPKNTS